MFELVIKGVVIGLILSIMLGPAFFVLLETSIRKGIKSALAFDAGVLVSDIVYIIIAYVFLKEVSQLADGDNNSLLKAVGGILFIGFGYYTFRKKIKETKLDLLETRGLYSRDYWMLFIKGLILNLANPLVVFYWFSVMTAGKPETSDGYAGWHMIVYLSVILITFFSIDVLKIIGAKKLRPFITTGVLRSLNHITGAVLMGFGIFLVVHSLVIWLRYP